MKISNSKQELARIISENGGWRDGNYAIQDKDDMRVWFTHKVEGKPCGHPYWPCSKSHAINHHSLLPNWHQTILSREEYFHLYPAPDADGWIEWNGGTKSPAGEGVLVDVKMRCGREHYCQLLDDECWSDAWGDENIIAYRLHKPEQAKSTAVGDDETDLAAKEELESMEYKPTIEQLAADYRNAKDCAERMQHDADAAKADADAKLKALELAGEALGLLVSPITAKPELVINDWRELQAGDEIWVSEHDGYAAGEYKVIDKEEDGFSDDYAVSVALNGRTDRWIDVNEEWKFIRRP